MRLSFFRMTAAALAAALNLFAQVQSGTISGVVTDQQEIGRAHV